MNSTTTAIVAFLALLGGSIWVGGLIAIAVVARVASEQLDPAARVAFFRAFGRRYLFVGVPALLVALIAGACLLADGDPGGLGTAATIVALVLVLVTIAGVIQARAMTRIRARVVAGDQEAVAKVQRGGAVAGGLRGAIALLSISLLALAAALLA